MLTYNSNSLLYNTLTKFVYAPHYIIILLTKFISKPLKFIKVIKVSISILLELCIGPRSPPVI